jgi:hypothetical protein
VCVCAAQNSARSKWMGMVQQPCSTAWLALVSRSAAPSEQQAEAVECCCLLPLAALARADVPFCSSPTSALLWLAMQAVLGAAAGA